MSYQDFIDLLSQVSPIAWICVAIFLAFIFCGRKSKPEAGSKDQDWNNRAGAAGEQKILNLLRQSGYEVLHDLVFRRPDGGTVQIDIAARSRTGEIYILEVKMFAGKIVTTSDPQYWTHNMKNGQTRRILNPMVQVEWQAEAVRQRTGYEPRCFAVNAGRASFPAGIIDWNQLIGKLKSVSCGEINTDRAWKQMQSWQTSTSAANQNLSKEHVRRVKAKWNK